ncbi:serine hydrolase [Promicromonospora sp. Marseille-Q5078]
MNGPGAADRRRDVARVRADLAAAGLTAGILVRDLADGAEIALDADVAMPVASLVKLPIAVATIERVRRGELDGSAPVTVEPGRMTVPGPPGTTRFRHPASVALDDLLYLAVALSDSGAADALLALTPPDDVGRVLREMGVGGFTVRHGLAELSETPAEALHAHDPGLGYALAATATRPNGSSAIRSLDTSVATTASARDVAGLLAEVWAAERVHPVVSARVRELMAANVHRQRLAPEFETDRSTWSSKTGTVLSLRHEAGVVEHRDGTTFVVVALSRSQAPAGAHPAAEAALGRAARRLHDLLRRDRTA